MQINTNLANKIILAKYLHYFCFPNKANPNGLTLFELFKFSKTDFIYIQIDLIRYYYKNITTILLKNTLCKFTKLRDNSLHIIASKKTQYIENIINQNNSLINYYSI